MAKKKFSFRETCPVCGRKEKWMETFTVKLKTATICDDCAKKNAGKISAELQNKPKMEDHL